MVGIKSMQLKVQPFLKLRWGGKVKKKHSRIKRNQEKNQTTALSHIHAVVRTGVGLETLKYTTHERRKVVTRERQKFYSPSREHQMGRLNPF